jgi:hypothetical protein
MLLEELSGTKIKKANSETQFKGFPLVVKKYWSVGLFTFYLLLLPVLLAYIYYNSSIKKRKFN